jgi:membrane protease subunit HflK
VPVSLVIATIPVQYRIKDLYSFLYNHNEPERLLESICYRELTKFAASAKIEVDSEVDSNQSLLGAGRAEAKRILTKNTQATVDKAGLGVEIVFLGLQGIHPPPELAADYQKVIGAVQQKQALILGAHAERNKVLSSLAGSVDDADKLYTLASKYQRAKQNNRPEETEKLIRELDLAFAQAKGDIFNTLRQAQSYAFEKAALARATGERFASQLKAYRAGEEIYKRQLRLAVFEEALENIRKFVVVADQNDTQVFIIDVQEKLTPSLYDLPGLEENSEK